MCGCSKGLNPLVVDGRVLYFANYETFNYLDGVELFMVKKNVIQPIYTRTVWNNRLSMVGVIQYALVSREEADGLLLKVKRGQKYFIEIDDYTITDEGIVEET